MGDTLEQSSLEELLSKDGLQCIIARNYVRIIRKYNK